MSLVSIHKRKPINKATITAGDTKQFGFSIYLQCCVSKAKTTTDTMVKDAMILQMHDFCFADNTL